MPLTKDKYTQDVCWCLYLIREREKNGRRERFDQKKSENSIDSIYPGVIVKGQPYWLKSTTVVSSDEEKDDDIDMRERICSKRLFGIRQNNLYVRVTAGR